MGIIVSVIIVGGLGFGLYRALRGAPSCTCGDQECGGGCIKRRK